MKISEAEVLHVARLSRLDLSAEAVETFAHQLGDILDHVASLNEVDTQGVAATSHVLDLTNALRPDDPGDHLAIEETLANAPEKSEDSFIVPKVVG